MRRIGFQVALVSLHVLGCGAESGDADGPPSFEQSPVGSAGNTARAGSGGAPTGVTPVANGGSPSGLGGRGGSEGNINPPLQPGGAGNAGAGNTPGNAGAGGAPAGVGGAGLGGAAGDGSVGQPTPDGPFTSVPVNGGASAAFVCPEGVAFGDPLAGMGAVQSVSAPQGGNFSFIEGPVWIGSRGVLFFSDNAPPGSERIWSIAPPFTTPVEFMPSSGSNGLAVDNQDQLLLADQRDRRITRVDSGSAAVLGDVLASGNHTPNDLVLRSDENLYFTDPQSGGRGLYRLSPVGQLDGPFTQGQTDNAPGAPNGVVLSPDENSLYVGDVQQNFVARFALLADGAIDTESGEVFTRTQGDTVDGMAVDCAGNLYVGTRTGVEVYSPDATLLGTVPTGESSNATFGGADRRTLFVTSRSVLKYVTLGVPGLPD
jgi:gluconolactonase